MNDSNIGGFSQPALPTDEVIKFAENVKEKVEIAAKRPFLEYKPVLFSQQIVSKGTNYHVKIQTGEMDYIQVHMEATMPEGGVCFNKLLDHQTREDPIRPYHQSPGGFTDVMLATPDIIGKAKELKGAVEKDARTKFPEFKAVLYRSQVVAGTKYMVKVQTKSAHRDYVHMVLSQGLPMPVPQPVELISHEYPKKQEDPLA